jgi:MFS family permease
MNKQNITGLRSSAFAALALAFASFGDAFLYPFLPINSNAIGVPVVWVGLLLSINRFARIFSNALMVRLLERFGLRAVMLTAVILAIISTFGYGIAAVLAAWLTFRVLWGLSFSAMRIGTLGYALQTQRPGFALGLSRGLQEVGPMASLFIAPILLRYVDQNLIFFVLGLLSLPAVYFASMLPKGENKTTTAASNRFLNWPTPLNAITFVSAILVDGVIVIVLGILFLHGRQDITLLGATMLAAFYLGYRRICLVALSPAGGWIADKVGLDRIFTTSIIFVIIGLVVIISGWIGTGAVIVFTFYGINSAMTPGSVSKGEGHSLSAVAENATWRDIGAAVGTLIGGILISSSHLTPFLIIAIFVLTLLVFIHLGTDRKTLKLLYLWR